jgi:hypothetical protein
MNERIKQLAEQAGVLADFGEDIKVGRWGIGGSYQSMEKFAELIVRACADAADMAYDARCSDVGDYVGEQLGYGEEHGITAWRHGTEE